MDTLKKDRDALNYALLRLRTGHPTITPTDFEVIKHSVTEKQEGDIIYGVREIWIMPKKDLYEKPTNSGSDEPVLKSFK